MAMFLMSEKLLEQELKNKPENPTDQQIFYYSMIEKELHLLRRLDIDMCDMRGTEEEFIDRLEHSKILVCTPKEVDEFHNALAFKDDVMEVINNWR